MPHLDSLLAELTGPGPGLPGPVAIATVTLAGGHCARMDSNAAAAMRVWKWSMNAAPTGWDPNDIAPLRVVHYFAQLADGQAGFKLATLNEIAAESREQLNITVAPADINPNDDALRLHRRVLLHLSETVASLPPQHLRKEATDLGRQDRYGDWVLERVLGWFPKNHGLAVFHQHHARMLLALGDLAGARSEVELALANAKPHMLQSIEASRQMQLTIDLENLSRADITADVTSKVTEIATEEVQQASRSLQASLLEEMEANARIERNTTSGEIREALLRVVEILGVFLAVAGVAVTAIGGIAVEGSLAVKIVVWGFGYGTVVSLFLLLRCIVGSQSVRDTWRSIRGKRDEPPDGGQG